jgi:hypothetical protein
MFQFCSLCKRFLFSLQTGKSNLLKTWSFRFVHDRLSSSTVTGFRLPGQRAEAKNRWS